MPLPAHGSAEAVLTAMTLADEHPRPNGELATRLQRSKSLHGAKQLAEAHRALSCQGRPPGSLGS